MYANKKNDADGSVKPDQPDKPLKIFHAMRNGTLYRSLDGITWERETDPTVSDIPEGTSRVTQLE
jgi:hypothetical protein